MHLIQPSSRLNRAEVVRSDRSERSVVLAFGGGDVLMAERIASALAGSGRGVNSGNATTLRPGVPVDADVLSEFAINLVVIPPLDRWLGMTAGMPNVRWARAIVEGADRVVAIGTGVFLLAACGQLDHRRVVASPAYERELALFAPNAITVGHTGWWHDHPITTAIDPDAAMAACRSLVDQSPGFSARRLPKVRAPERSAV